MRFAASITLFIIGILLLLYSFNFQEVSGYVVKSSIDIAVNGLTGFNSYQYAATPFEGGNIFSIYKLDTGPEDSVDVRYSKGEGEVEIINMPGDLNQFSLIEKAADIPEKVDPDLLNQEFLQEEEYLKDGRVSAIVSFKSSPDFNSLKSSFISELSSSLNLSYYSIKNLDFVNAVLIDIEPSEIQKIADLQVVEQIDLDRKVQAILDVSRPLIKAEQVWKLADSQGRNLTGKGIEVAVIDTGVDYTHPDLGGCFGSSCKVVGGWDFVNADADPMDDHGHGTHVAATVAGVNNQGLAGIAPDAKIYGYKVLNSGGSGSWSQVINGIKRAVDPNNDGNKSDHVDIISMSLGGVGTEDDPIAKAVDEAVDAGVVVISAAGNSGTANGAVGVPAAAKKGIAVAATDDLDKLASFSSRGPTSQNNLKPDIAAPGVNICAAEWDSWLTDRRCVDNKHISISGTSMATPHVSGAAALILQAHPDWSPQKVKSALMSVSKDLNLKPWEQGTGRIDILNSVQAKVVTNPASISFGLASGTEFSADIEIENVDINPVELSLSADKTLDESGNGYDFATLDKSSINLNSGGKTTVKITIKLTESDQGKFYGYVKINDGSKIYRVPYYFVSLSGVTVEVVDGNKALAPYILAIRNGDMSTRQIVTKGWDFSGNSYTFSVKSGNYTIYAIGDYNKSLHYILSKQINTGGGPTKIKMDISEGKKFDIYNKAIDGRDIDLEDFSYFIKETIGSKFMLLGLNFMRADLRGPRSIYLSETVIDGVKKDLAISYKGYPHRENDQGKSAFDWRGETYNGGDSLYFIYWKFNGIEKNTSTNLAFTPEELAEYTYTHNLPGKDPNEGAADFGNSYMTYDFWTNPLSTITMASGEKPTIPLTRKVYVKAGNYAFQHKPNINYLRFDKSLQEFAAQSGQIEYDVKTQLYWPVGTIATAGEKRSLDHGTSPFILTHFENWENTIRLEKYLIKGNSKETYIFKKPKVSYWSTTGDSGSVDLPKAHIKVFEDDKVTFETDLKWDADYILSRIPQGNPTFRVEIDVPTAYDIQKENKITGTFKIIGQDVNPPYLDSLKVSPRFEQNLDLEFSIKDAKVSNDFLIVKAYYSSGSNWQEINLSRTGSLYSGKIDTINLEFVDLKLTSSDGTNTIEYISKPISKKAHDLDLNFKADKTKVNIGDTVYFSGKIADKNGYALTQSYLKYLLDSNFLGFSRGGYSISNAGLFNLKQKIVNVSTEILEFTASYAGSGIYKPKEEKIQVTVNIPGPKLLNYTIEPANPTTNTDVTLKSSWSEAFKVILKSNYTGEWKEYNPKKDGNEYSYTIKAKDLQVGFVGWQFEAEDKNKNKKTMPLKVFKVREFSADMTLVNLVSFSNNKGWGETWNFICSASDSEGDKLDINLLAKKPGADDWEIRETKSLSDTLDTKNISFSTTLDSSFIGSVQIKCQAIDPKGVINGSSANQITVERDDVKLDLVEGKLGKVDREGNNKLILSFRTTDIDRNFNLTEAAGTKIKITNDNTEPYDLEVDCNIEKSMCSVNLDPDEKFSVGNQTFEGTLEDTSYKISTSQKSNFLMVGSLFADFEIPGKVKRGENLEISITIKDDLDKSVDVDSIAIEYRELFSAGQWKICSTVKNPEVGKYSCDIQTEPLLPGLYNVKVVADKLNYNKLEKESVNKFFVRSTEFKTYKINKTEEKKAKLHLPNLNLSLDFGFKEDMEDQEFNFTLASENPVTKNFIKLSSFDKYLTIDPPEGFNQNLSSVEIRINYTDSEVSSKNFEESSLRLSFFNTTSQEWESFDPPFGGVNTTENYVWANVTHLSDFGVGGKLANGSVCTTSSECSSGNCASDYDGSGSWCAPAGSCASNGFVNYPSGSTTCYSNNQVVCSTGTWSTTTCSNGCSAGECIVLPPPQEPTTPTAPTGGSGGGGGGSSSGDIIIGQIPNCKETDFECTEWSSCLEDQQTRTCYKRAGISCQGEVALPLIQTCQEQEDRQISEIEKSKKEEKGKPAILTIEELPIVVQSVTTERPERTIFITAAVLLIIIAIFVALAWKK